MRIRLNETGTLKNFTYLFIIYYEYVAVKILVQFGTTVLICVKTPVILLTTASAPSVQMLK